MSKDSLSCPVDLAIMSPKTTKAEHRMRQEGVCRHNSYEIPFRSMNISFEGVIYLNFRFRVSETSISFII